MNSTDTTHPEEEALTAHALGEGAAAERAALDAHLRACPACRRRLREAEETALALRAAPPAACTRDHAPLLAARLRRGRRRAVLARAAAAALVAAGLGILVLSLRPGGERPAAASAVAADLAPALRWLERTQEADGSWAPEKWGGKREYAPALSALAVLPLAADAASREEVLRAAAGYFRRVQRPDGLYGEPGPGELYNHALALAAVLALDARLGGTAGEGMRRAAALVLRRQDASGGWSYLPGQRPNAPLSVWQVHALLRARRAGIAEADAGLARAAAWLPGALEADRAGYASPLHAGAPAALAAMAAGSLMELAAAGFGVDREVLARLRPAPGAAEGPAAADVYRLHFALRATPRADAAARGRLRAELLSRRDAGGACAGTWAPDEAWGRVGGRLSSTGLALLALM